MTIPKFKPVAFKTYKGYLLHYDDPRALNTFGISPLFTADQQQQAYEAGKQAAVPEGFKIVPIDPTEEMISASWIASKVDPIDNYISYKAMIEVSPEPKK